MKRSGIAVVIACFCFVNAALSQQWIMPREFEKHGFSIPVPQQKKPNISEDRFRMPFLTPTPDIDYKIQRVEVDDAIDYKILDAAPRIDVTLEQKQERQQILPPMFKYPGIINNVRFTK